VSQRLADLLTVAGAQPLGESLTQLQCTCTELDEFVHSIIEELAALHNELDLRRQQIGDAWRELDDAKRASAQTVADPQLAGQIAALEAERSELKHQLETSSERLNKLATVAVGVAEAKAETAGAKTELAAVRSELAETKAALERALESGGGHTSTEVELRLRAQLDEHARERALSDTQLESVRERAAELAVQLEEQQRQFAEERQRWQSQLADLTRLVASHNRGSHSSTSDTIVTEQPRCTASPVRRAPHRPDHDAPQGNPVIDSVMAQFQMVQREAARRRAKAS
jgi:chromosome segregation ATPase